LTSSILHGQAINGSLVGTITDSSGGAVVGAPVIMLETRTGISRQVTTNSSGFYTAPDVAPGVYRLTVEVAGFRKLVRDNVQVLVNTTVRVDLELTPGSVNESVEVKAQLPNLQTDRADTGRKIETREITDMPLGFNRNFQGLLNLVPGVDRVVRIHSEFYNPQDSLSTEVNGQGEGGNNFQIEGVDDNYRTNRLTILIPPIEALDTVDVSTSNYAAELGRAGGAVTNVSLKSGTNDFHGSLYEFNRVSALGARNVFAHSKTQTVYNQFGATIGGPIIHNKTFFFGDYQGVYDRRGDLTLATIPTMPFRTGNLAGSPTTIYDPSTGNPDGTGRTEFSGSQIPASRISPIAMRILNLVPAPTSPGQNTNFQRAVSRAKDQKSFDTKVDHQITPNHRISARYSLQRVVTDEPPVFGLAGGPTVGEGPAGTSGHGLQTAQSGAVSYTPIFSPSFIGDFRLGVMRYRNDARQSDYGTDASAKLGIPGVNISDFTSGLTGINIGGFSSPMVGYTLSLPWVRAETGLFLVGSLTKVKSNHTIKVGGEIRGQRDVADLPDTYGSRGSFSFNAGPTALNGDRDTSFANSFASFLLDQPSTTSRELRRLVPESDQTSFFSYIQDKWQVTPKVTIDVGLRHELYLPQVPHSPGGFSNYDPNTNTLLTAGIGKVPMNLGIDTDWTGFEPRIGVAWRINDKTVLRGGFGGSLVTPGLETKAYYNYPVRQYFVTTAPNTYTAAGSLAAGFPPPPDVIIPSDGIIHNPPDNSFHFIDPNFKYERLRSWNIALQRVLPGNFVFEAAYVGNHGSDEAVTRDINAGLTPGAGLAGQPIYQEFGIRTSVVNDYYPTTSDYQSLQVKFDRRFSNGFLLTTAYTYSKAINYADNGGGLFINAIPSLNRARSSNNPTHIFVQSYIYELPFGKNRRWFQSGIARYVLGDWSVNGILTLDAGLPLSFTTSSVTLNAPGNGNRPNVAGTPSILGNVGPGTLWFDTSGFSAPAPATYGNVGRNILSGPGFANLDFSLFRRFPITERINTELRFEALNSTNTPHFNNPNTSLGSAGFGQITTAMADQRLIQIGLKVSF